MFSPVHCILTGAPRFEGRKEDSHPVVVPAEAAIVERIFREFIDGRSMTAIARGLNEARVLTKKGVHWRQAQASSGIVRNQLYVGMVRYKDEGVFDGVHGPIFVASIFSGRAPVAERQPHSPLRHAK